MASVIFDMDGLLVDSEGAFALAWDWAGEKLGIGPAGFMKEKTLGASLKMTLPLWKAEFGESFDAERFRQYSREFLAVYFRENPMPEKPGAGDLVRYLAGRGVPMAVASSSPRWEVELHLSNLGLTDYFSAILTGDDVTASKPEPEIYQKACAALGVLPKDAFALEDARNGLVSAHRAGCRVLMVPDRWQPDEEVKGFVEGMFPDLLAVKAYLEEKL